MKSIREYLSRLRGEVTTEELIRRGLKVGANFKRLNHVIIDASHTWLIELGYDVIIGANSTVTQDIPAGSVAAGSPARVICTTEEYLRKERERMKSAPVYGEEYTMRGAITEQRKQEQKEALADGKIGYVE